LQHLGNANINPKLIAYADRAVHTFNFSGADQASSKTTDAPVFGGLGQSGVAARGATPGTFVQVMQGYYSTFTTDSRNESGSAPQLAVRTAENAL